MKNVLVIGGSYFVGRIFVEELSKVPDHAIYVMNRGRAPLGIKGITEIRCDRHDTEAMNETIPSIMWSAVVDFCAYTPADIAIMTSVLPDHAVGQYIFMSTASVYGNTNDLPICEDAPKVSSPRGGLHGDYAHNKILAEEELKSWCSQGRTPWTILRPTFIYGKYNYAPRESYFFDLLLDGRIIVLPENGLALFTFVSVWDVGRAVMACMGNPDAHERAFNLSGEELVSYPRLMDVLRTVSGLEMCFEYISAEKILEQGLPLPFPLDEHLVYSGALITKDLGFKYTPFLSGMRATYEWYSRMRGERT